MQESVSGLIAIEESRPVAASDILRRWAAIASAAAAEQRKVADLLLWRLVAELSLL